MSSSVLTKAKQDTVLYSLLPNAVSHWRKKHDDLKSVEWSLESYKKTKNRDIHRYMENMMSRPQQLDEATAKKQAVLMVAEVINNVVVHLETVKREEAAVRKYVKETITSHLTKVKEKLADQKRLLKYYRGRMKEEEKNLIAQGHKASHAKRKAKAAWESDVSSQERGLAVIQEDLKRLQALMKEPVQKMNIVREYDPDILNRRKKKLEELDWAKKNINAWRAEKNGFISSKINEHVKQGLSPKSAQRMASEEWVKGIAPWRDMMIRAQSNIKALDTHFKEYIQSNIAYVKEKLSYAEGQLKETLERQQREEESLIANGQTSRSAKATAMKRYKRSVATDKKSVTKLKKELKDYIKAGKETVRKSSLADALFNKVEVLSQANLPALQRKLDNELNILADMNSKLKTKEAALIASGSLPKYAKQEAVKAFPFRVEKQRKIVNSIKDKITAVKFDAQLKQLGKPGVERESKSSHPKFMSTTTTMYRKIFSNEGQVQKSVLPQMDYQESVLDHSYVPKTQTEKTLGSQINNEVRELRGLMSLKNKFTGELMRKGVLPNDAIQKASDKYRDSIASKETELVGLSSKLSKDNRDSRSLLKTRSTSDIYKDFGRVRQAMSVYEGDSLLKSVDNSRYLALKRHLIRLQSELDEAI